MAVWMTAAVPLFANLYEPGDKKKMELLVQMLHRLEAFTLWGALAGVPWGAVRTILVTGEPQPLRLFNAAAATRGSHIMGACQ